MKSKTSTPTPSNTNRVIAIDPGFDRMGVAILEKDSKERVLFSTCITTSPKETRAKRLFQVGSELREIMREWQPTHFAIESLFFNQNTTSALGVAEARGVAIYEAGLVGLLIHEYSPQEIKIAVTGYGKASKLDVQKMVEKLVRLPGLPKGRKRLDDELDAVAIGITHFAHSATRSRLSTDYR